MTTDTAAADAAGAPDDHDDAPPPSSEEGPESEEPPRSAGSPDADVIEVAWLDDGPAPADVDPAWISGRLAQALDQLARPVARLSVAVVGDEHMAALHLRHAGIAGTTDVLAFTSAATDEAIDADIAVCADEARRQAAERGHAVSRELLLYCLHGVLHCVGHDDHDDDARAAMHAEEDRLLEAIGVGATFARDRSRHDDARAPGEDRDGMHAG